MKLQSINITNLFGARDIRLDGMSPITLLCGQNHAAKSSVRHAVAMAITGDIARIHRKMDCGLMITDGAKSGTVTVEVDGRNAFTAHVTKTAVKAPGAAEFSDSLAARVCLGTLRPGDQRDVSADALRSLVLGIMGARVSARAVAAELKAAGHLPEHVDRIAPIIASGFDTAAKSAAEFASEARGAWKATTGEVYGSEKAETWARAIPDGIPSDDEIAELRAVRGDIEVRHREANQRLLQIIANNNVMAEAVRSWQSRRDALAAKAAGNADAARREAAARDALAMVSDELAGLPAAAREAAGGAKPSIVDRLASLAALFSEEVASPENEGIPGHVADAIDALGLHSIVAEYEAQSGAKVARPWAVDGELPSMEEIERARDLLAKAATAQGAASHWQRIASDAKAATDALAALDDQRPEDPDRSEESAANAMVAELAELLGSASSTLADAERQHAAASKAAADTAKAAAAHAEVKAWTAIVAELSPSGIPGRMAAAAMEPLTSRLAQSAADTGWPVVTIGDDWVARYGGRPYTLLSESEKWRADAMLSEAIAHFSGFRMVILDAMDLLAPGDRMAPLHWLAACIDAGELDSAVVMATLASVPPAAALPECAVAHWVESGTCHYTREEQPA